MKTIRSFLQNLFKSKWEIEFEKELETNAEECAEIIVPVMDKLSNGENVEFVKCVHCGEDAHAKELLEVFKDVSYINGVGPLCNVCREK